MLQPTVIVAVQFIVLHSIFVGIVFHNRFTFRTREQPDVPRRLALSNSEHLVSLSSEHTDRQTDS